MLLITRNKKRHRIKIDKISKNTKIYRSVVRVGKTTRKCCRGRRPPSHLASVRKISVLKNCKIFASLRSALSLPKPAVVQMRHLSRLHDISAELLSPVRLSVSPLGSVNTAPHGIPAALWDILSCIRLVRPRTIAYLGDFHSSVTRRVLPFVRR